MITKSMMVRVGADTTEMERGLKSAEARMKKFREQCKKIGRGMTVAGTAIVAALTLVTKKASDAQETYAKFGTVFKDSSEEAEQAATELTKRYGLSTLASKEMLSATGDLLTGLGMQGKVALSLSQRTQKLSVDLASFTNYSGGAKGASEALTKAMLGERESVKALGIVITEEMVKEHLLKEGKEKLTGMALLQAKAEATLAIAVTQSKNAIGDYERTSGSLANVVRRLKARLTDIWVVIGTKLIPVVTDLSKKVINFVEKAKEWIETHPKLAAGIVKVAAVVGALMVVLGPLAMVLPGLVTGFSMLGGALSVLCGPAGLVIIAVAGIALALKDMVDTLKDAKKAMSDLVDEAAILSQGFEIFIKLGEAAKEAGGKLAGQWDEIIKAFRGGTKEFSKFRGDWQGILRMIVRDPKFKELKDLLLDIAGGVKTVSLEGKELSISLPKSIQKVNEAVKKGGNFWLEFAKAAASFARVTAVKLMTLKGMADKALDLGPAFKLPDFTRGKKEFKSFADFIKAWVENIKKLFKEMAESLLDKWSRIFDELRGGVSAMDAVFSQFHENQATRIDNEEKKRIDALESWNKKEADVLDSWYEREREKIEATITNEEEKNEALAALEEEKVAKMEALDEEKARREDKLQHEMDKKRRKLARAQAKSQKVAALFGAGINVAEAITKAFSQGGFVLGPVFGMIIAALGAIQIAAIAAAPLPALAKGGRIETAAIVGEKGVELFVPDRPGTIYPLHGGARMMGRPFTFSPVVNIYTKTLDDYTIDRAAEKIFAALEKERGRFG